MAITAAELRTLTQVSSAVTDEELTMFIEHAGVIVTDNLTGSGLSVSTTDLIQLYLAAHLVTISINYGGFTHQKVGDSEERYQPVSEKNVGLMSTRFGQTAISLDSTGSLSKLAGPPKKALFEVI